MKEKQILVISHAGAEGKNPFIGEVNNAVLDHAKIAIQTRNLRFDLVLFAPCEPARITVAALVPTVPPVALIPLMMLDPQGEQMQKVLPLFSDLGLYGETEQIINHPLVHSLDSLAEAVGWEVDQKVSDTKADSVIVVVFPPITNLLISYLRCGEHGGSPWFEGVVLNDKFRSCEGYLLHDSMEGVTWLGGIDSRFPDKNRL